MSLTVASLADRPGRPLGTSHLPERGIGVDLAPWGYVEEEFLVAGRAQDWRDEAGAAAPAGEPEPFLTRVLVRRPRTITSFNGIVHVEPLHPDYDQASSWRMLHPHVLRTGAAWVGITHDHRMVPVLGEQFDPVRYAGLRVASPGHRYDIVGSVVAGLRHPVTSVLTELAEAVTSVVMSGWSFTGSFCRVFLQDGFHDRHRLPDGRPAVDGYLIGISSGAAGDAGYPPLAEGGPTLAADDPRRTIAPHGVPVIELLSEMESETNATALRPDSDTPEDPYRLYQVAGTSHHVRGTSAVLTNREQCRERGLPVSATKIREEPSDARMDVVARGVYAALERWVRDGEIPPRAERFGYAGDAPTSEPGAARDLARDRDGNVRSGLRPPWVTVPAATYLPHSTPEPGYCQPSPWAPMGTPEMVAGLIGHRRTFPCEVLVQRYGTPEEYLIRYCAAVDSFAETWRLDEADRHALYSLGERTAAAWAGSASADTESTGPTDTERNISA